MKEKTNKNRWLHVRLDDAAYKTISKYAGRSTCRTISEYARKRLLEKPVTVTYCNQSLDDFMAELMRLRNDLNAIGNNFNQSVRKLHSLNLSQDVLGWITGYESQRTAMLEQTERIQQSIQKFAEQWLQSSKQDHP